MMAQAIGPFYLERKSTWTGGSRWWVCGRRGVCGNVLKKWFDVDPGKPLWLRFYKRPAVDRLKIERGFLCDGRDYVAALKKNGKIENVWVAPDWIDHPPATYPYYVSVVQEED